MSEATDTAAATPADAEPEIDGQLSLIGAADDSDTTDATDTGKAKAKPAEPDDEDDEPEAKAVSTKKAAADADKADAAESEAEVIESPKAKKAVRSAKRPVKAGSDGGVPGWVLVVLGALVVALGVSTGLLWSNTRGTLSQDQIDKAVRTAASTAQHISSWDYRTIKQDVAVVLDETTGDFHKAYEASAEKLLQTAPEQQAVTVGLTSKAGVEAVRDDGSVTVLVFLNQQTTSKDADPHIEQHRLRLTMVEKDGLWLVSKLEVLG
ncbi:hypothetical protein LO762_13850 [Actinocorallia sp. API 0066]|uniref:hypothetical protein n=1 Tax=Actinocorallia sp. API 0066 TaxID=2896846 RepID=UPI001E2D8D20|nr:hypothetical protein [Actinocorallia sp. API 0066]MCD0450268.1 hypothetical protein [Actinocorallia sp. API 0066]